MNKSVSEDLIKRSEELKVKIKTWQLKYEPGKVRSKIKGVLVVARTTTIQKYPVTVEELVAVYDGRVYTEVTIISLFSRDEWNADIGRDIVRERGLSSIANRIFCQMRKKRLNKKKKKKRE